MTKYYTANVDPSRLIVVTNRAGTVAPNGGAKGIYALQEPHFRMPRDPAREEAEAKERAKKKAAFRAAMIKRNTK